MRAINQNRDELVVQQLGSIIDFAASKFNISKDLEQALLRLRKSMNEAKQDHEKLVEKQRQNRQK